VNGFHCFIKFIFDRVMALLGLLGLSWLLAIIALLVKIKMPGQPVLYRQQRVGRYGKLFTIHKFRTMEGEQENASVAFVEGNRVTPFGARLRRYKLDELPELWDVLVGKMSFVGPRPDVPGYADQLEGEDRLVLEMRPGITGLATLKYRDEESLIEDYVKKAKAEGDPRPEAEIALWYNDQVIYPDKVRLNLQYYRNYSVFLDLKILFQTLF
jgi:lipopolysaccharide/colanic/teichoic acid biosynthesis glycosyltransferase